MADILSDFYVDNPPEEYSEYLRSIHERQYDLYISDLYIFEPFKTEIPYIAKSGYYPELKKVLKHQRIDINKEVVDVRRALRIALMLLNINFKKKKDKKRVEDLVLNNYLIFRTSDMGITNDDNDILGFYFSKYFDLDYINTKIPLITLLRERPDLIFHDRIVQISIALLRELFLIEAKDVALRVKNVMLKTGLNAFIPPGISTQRPTKRALLVFKNSPEILITIVKVYEIVLKKYAKKNREYGNDKKSFINSAYQEIYKNPIPDNIVFRGEEDKDMKSIALKLISVEFDVPFEGLKKQYYNNKHIENNIKKPKVEYTSKLIVKAKPHLLNYIKQINLPTLTKTVTK